MVAAKIDHERAGGADVILDHKLAKIAARRKSIDDTDNAYPVLLRRYIEEHARPHTKSWRDMAPAFDRADRPDTAINPRIRGFLV
jgi:hypothetical protein